MCAFRPRTNKLTATDQVETSWVEEAYSAMRKRDYHQLSRIITASVPNVAKNSLEQAFFHYYSSRVLFSYKDVAASISELTAAEVLFHAHGRYDWQINTIVRIASDFSTVGEVEKSIRYFNRAMSLVFEHDETRLLIPMVSGDYATTLFQHGVDFWKGLDLTEQAFTTCTSTLDYGSALMLATNGSAMTDSVASLRQSLRYSQQGKELMKMAQKSGEQYFLYRYELTPTGMKYVQSDITDKYASLLINHGTTLQLLGDFAAALQCFEEAERIARVNNYEDVLVSGANQMGSLFMEQKDYHSATQQFSAALQILEHSNTRSTSRVILHANLAESLFYLGDIDASNAHFNTAQQLCVELRLKSESIRIKALMCELYIEYGSINLARDFLVGVLEEAKKLAMHEVVTTCYRLLGKIAIRREPAIASDFLTKALVIAEEQQNKRALSLVHKELTHHYKLIGESTLALIHSEKAGQYREELNKEEVKTKMANLAILQEVDRYKAELLEKDRVAEKLSFELQERKKELNDLILRISERHEYLKVIESGLSEILRLQPMEKDSAVVNLLKSVRSMSTSSADKKELNRLFNDVNEAYVKQILNLAPNISPAEMKVCVLLLMSMDTKHIAETLCLSVRSVENHRTNIRHKLGIDANVPLNKYLMQVQKP